MELRNGKWNYIIVPLCRNIDFHFRRNPAEELLLALIAMTAKNFNLKKCSSVCGWFVEYVIEEEEEHFCGSFSSFQGRSDSLPNETE